MVLRTQLNRSECFPHSHCSLAYWMIQMFTSSLGAVIPPPSRWRVYWLWKRLKCYLILFQWGWWQNSFPSEIQRGEDAAFQGRSGGLVDCVLQVPALCFQLSLLGEEASFCKRETSSIDRQGWHIHMIWIWAKLIDRGLKRHQWKPLSGGFVVSADPGFADCFSLF